MRIGIGLGILLEILLANGLAWGDAPADCHLQAPPGAPEVWTRGRSILSGERLVAVQVWQNYDGVALDLHFLYVAWGLSTPPNPYNLPSLAYDHVMADRVTIGGSAGFISGNVEGSAWIVGVRGGYVLPITDGVALWGRAGLGYFATYAGRNSAERVTGVFVTLAPQFVFGIGSHFALTLGVTGDLPLTGTRRRRQYESAIIAESGQKWIAVGLMMGALFHF